MSIIFTENLLSIFILSFVVNFFLISDEEKKERVVISSSEAKILEDYSKALLTATPIGYSLFGEKPVSFYSYQIPENNHGDDWLSSYIWSGNNILKRIYHLKPESNFYLLINEDLNGEIVVINRPQFLRVVEENLSLFRYILGPSLTPQNLLESIVEHKKNLYECVNQDEALIGILLGFGTDSSILYRRYLQLKEDPLIAPSWGFANAQVEYSFVLNQVNHPIHPYLIHHAPALNFCAVGDEKNQLVEKYLHTQMKIREVLSQQNLFQKLWSKIEPGIELSIDNTTVILSEKSSLGKQQQEQYVMEKKGAEIEADQFLSRLAKEKNIIEIAPGAVYLKLLKQGIGECTSNYPLVRCSIPNAHGYPLQQESIQHFDLNRTMKSLRQGLLSRRVGDQGILYIHPSWTDDDYWSLPYHLIVFHFEILKSS